MGLYVRRLEIGSVAFWALLVSASLANSLATQDELVSGVALARARMVFTLIETTRLWNARHGGLYAPVTEATPPNPWLEDRDRDVTINGRPFTKLNPAYMTRQLSEMVVREQDVSFRITSLRPIRPGNVPDPWEKGALESFEGGAAEYIGYTEYQGAPAYRYMARLLVSEPCLKCHAEQGYKPGDVRGGISVTVPAGQVHDELAPQRRQTMALHAGFFLVLSAATLLFISRLKSSWRALAEAKVRQEAMVAERTAELRAANAELARSNAELEHFAYVASHDLQEPVRMMGAYAQLVERRYADRLDAEGREFLGFMGEGAVRMKTMIDDLLAYSRVGRGEPALRPVDLDLVVDGALANLAAAIAEAGAVISRPGKLPTVSGELPLLVRLMQNLIGNAVKYRRPGTVPVIAITAEAGPDGMTVAVADNGIGIPEDARERIFLIFQRLHSRTAYPGTGIGLAIAKKIVERHGGRIWVDGNPDGGSTFRFTLPG